MFKGQISYLSKFSGTNIHATFNANHGFPNDIRECSLNLYKKTCTNPVELLKQTWMEHALGHPGESYLHFCHSQGTIHTRNALEDSPEPIRKLIHVVAIAPAAYIPRKYCGEVTHYVSERDFVPLFDRKGRRMCKDTIVVLKPHKGAPLFDHSFQSLTYAKSIKREINNFLKKK